MRSEVLPGATVTVRVDGEDLNEYGAMAEEDAPATTAYIEAIPGTTFSVVITLDAQFAHHKEDLRVVLKMDGVKMDKMVEAARQSNAKHSVMLEGRYETVRGNYTVRHFTLAARSTNDRVPSQKEFDSLKNLGKIKVTLQRCRATSSVRASSTKPLAQSTNAEVSEKALKGRAISSRTQLAEPKKTESYDTVTLVYPHGKTPIGVFTLLYRTYRDLQAEGIIPRTPEPIALEDRDPESLSAKEALELIRRLKAEQAEALQQKLRAKQEKAGKRGHAAISGGDGGEADDEVELTQESDRAKRAKNAEVIDLSYD